MCSTYHLNPKTLSFFSINLNICKYPDKLLTKTNNGIHNNI